MNQENYHNQQQGLYSKEFEHDNCGIGAVVNIKGVKSHQIVDDALKIVENLEHRAGKDALGETGKGFSQYIMVVGLCETVALFAMVFSFLV